MNYTETYQKIYSIVSEAKLPHEKTHKAALRITDALNDLFVYTNRQFPELMNQILNAAQDFCDDIKIGGYDLDDKGMPVGMSFYKDGTNLTGLKNKR